ncbi:Uncharacterised protein [Mycobacterium tuberculosis]|uniref:Uncharacterized protein n=1 Tax=Mycobacterium tuberculosis TaxID=1773 RepID=A0A916LFR5_MYCTX|nr:Uncharacterised protein [Mycobacterium tuberculosis]COZ84607.1 Uncharacterised protein [Mycobacterium tuberculosis]CPA48375.1 Uncharacterised protein [Mycobacterium tuberculosis]
MPKHSDTQTQLRKMSASAGRNDRSAHDHGLGKMIAMTK